MPGTVGWRLVGLFDGVIWWDYLVGLFGGGFWMNAVSRGWITCQALSTIVLCRHNSRGMVKDINLIFYI